MNAGQWWAVAAVAVSLGMSYGAASEGRWALSAIQFAYAVANVCWLIELRSIA